MSLALRHSPIAAPPPDFVPVAEASRLTGMSVSRWQKVAAANADKGLAFFQQIGKSKPTWHVSLTLHHLLTPSSLRGSVASSLRDRYPEHLIDRALLKKKWLDKWADGCETPRVAGVTDVVIADRVATEARQVEGQGFRISARSLQLWKAAHRDGGLDALIDRYGRTAHETLIGRSPEAVAYFYDCYRQRSQPSVAICHQMTLRESRRQNQSGGAGWSWPQCPSGTRRWLAQHDDLSLSFLTREGRDRWARKFLPYADVDDSMVAPGHMYVADHHQLDAWVTDGKTQFRPWLTAVQDLRSRTIVGWHLGASPHQDAIIRALHRAFRGYAIPKTLRLDNGRDFASKLITGLTSTERRTLRKELGPDWRDAVRRGEHLQVCNDNRWPGITGELGIEVIFSIPYHPWSKGRVERFFGTFARQCVIGFPTFCGRDVVRKPEFLDEIRRGYSREQRREFKKKYGRDFRRAMALKLVDESNVPTLDQARTWVGDWLDVYHREVHKFGVPVHLWSQATTLRRAAENELLLLMQSRGVYKVFANGVRFKVGTREHGYGKGHAALRPLIGREVFITCDPDDISYCIAWTAGEKRTYIARLASNERIPAYTTVDTERELVAQSMREQNAALKAEKGLARKHLTFAQRVREDASGRRVELRATGTDDVVECSVEPVRTALKAATLPVRMAVETPPEDDGFGDLLPVHDDEDFPEETWTDEEDDEGEANDAGQDDWPELESEPAIEDEGDVADDEGLSAFA